MFVIVLHVLKWAYVMRSLQWYSLLDFLKKFVTKSRKTVGQIRYLQDLFKTENTRGVFKEHSVFGVWVL